MKDNLLLSKIFPESSILRDGTFLELGIIDSKTEINILSFIESEAYLETLLSKTHITSVITTKEVGKVLLERSNIGIVVSDTPKIDFFKLHNKLNTYVDYCRCEKNTVIGGDCTISPLAFIASKNVTIGNHVIIEEFVSIKENTVIDDFCTIRAGTIIGGCGFEFKGKQDDIFRVEHFGGVHLNENVEVQYNCEIDKAVFPWDDTVIGKNTKINSLVFIAHASNIGENVLFPAGTTVGGRAVIGNDVWIGLGSIISNGVIFGNNSRCNIGAVVTKEVEEGTSVTGNFAIDHHKFLENLKKIR